MDCDTEAVVPGLEVATVSKLLQDAGKPRAFHSEKKHFQQDLK